MAVPPTPLVNGDPSHVKPRRHRPKKKCSDKAVTTSAAPRYSTKKSSPSSVSRGSNSKKKQRNRTIKIPHLSEGHSDFFEEDDVSNCSLTMPQGQDAEMQSKMTSMKLGDYMPPDTSVSKFRPPIVASSKFDSSLLPSSSKPWPSSAKLPEDSPLMYCEPWLPPEWPSMFNCFDRNSTAPTDKSGSWKAAVTSRGLVDLDKTDPCLPDRYIFFIVYFAIINLYRVITGPVFYAA